MKNVKRARTRVQAMFPVRFAPPGKIGMTPRKLFVIVFFLSYVLPGHVMDHHNDRLHECRQSLRGLLLTVVCLVPAGSKEHYDQDQEGTDHQGEDVLRYGQVQRARHAPVGSDLNQLAGIFKGIGLDPEAFICLAFSYMLRREDVPSAGLGVEDHREVDSHRMAFPGPHMPFI